MSMWHNWGQWGSFSWNFMETNEKEILSFQKDWSHKCVFEDITGHLCHHLGKNLAEKTKPIMRKEQPRGGGRVLTAAMKPWYSLDFPGARANQFSERKYHVQPKKCWLTQEARECRWPPGAPSPGAPLYLGLENGALAQEFLGLGLPDVSVITVSLNSCPRQFWTSVPHSTWSLCLDSLSSSPPLSKLLLNLQAQWRVFRLKPSLPLASELITPFLLSPENSHNPP